MNAADRQRLDQLLALAREGNEAAIADLWTEFGISWSAGAEIPTPPDPDEP